MAELRLNGQLPPVGGGRKGARDAHLMIEHLVLQHFECVLEAPTGRRRCGTDEIVRLPVAGDWRNELQGWMGCGRSGLISRVVVTVQGAVHVAVIVETLGEERVVLCVRVLPENVGAIERFSAFRCDVCVAVLGVARQGRSIGAIGHCVCVFYTVHFFKWFGSDDSS